MNSVYDPNLALYLPLHKRDGVSFESEDKHSHLCTVTGALWTAQGRSFDGTDDWISLGNPSALDFGGKTAFTIEAWVKATAPTNVANYNIVCLGRLLILYRYKSGGIYATLVDSGGTQREIGGDLDAANNGWSHVLAQYDGGQYSLWVDAVKSASVWNGVTTLHSPAQSGDAIGSDFAGTQFFWSGSIGEVRIYNRALIPLEIHRNYRTTKWRYR